MLNVKRHRTILFNILQDIYQSDIASALSFKGGTMLYFFYDLDRFSVDLDFDLIDHSMEEKVYQRLREIMQKYGVIDDEMNKRFTLFFLLRYAPGEMGVKIDVSKRAQVNDHYILKNFYGTDVQTLVIEDAFAHKLVAATERNAIANRDFYDIHFLFKKGIGFNDAIITERLGYSALEHLSKLETYVEKNITPQTILAGLGELVDEKQKVYTKTKLKKNLLAQIAFAKDHLQEL